DAEIDDYAELIQADASLSNKLLGVTNASWVGPHRSVRTIKQAVSLLGTSNVRALAMSHSLTELYSRWELDQEDARAYCEASLCKAVAAQILALVAAPERAEEVFAISLFQDIGLGLFVATANTEFAELLRDPRFTVRSQLRYEYAHFGLDHVAAGRLLGQKLGLPRIYLDVSRFHHDERELTCAVNDHQIVRALHVAALLPHDIRSWKPEDILYLTFALKELFAGRWTGASTASAFIHDVEPEFARLATILSPHSATSTSLEEAMNRAYDDNVRFAIPAPQQVYPRRCEA
ncbi:unnamed protein product, partial [marine sediment metagenome]